MIFKLETAFLNAFFAQKCSPKCFLVMLSAPLYLLLRGVQRSYSLVVTRCRSLVCWRKIFRERGGREIIPCCPWELERWLFSHSFQYPNGESCYYRGNQIGVKKQIFVYFFVLDQNLTNYRSKFGKKYFFFRLEPWALVLEYLDDSYPLLPQGSDLERDSIKKEPLFGLL